ncbi:ferredoxin--NADP reductase [Saccharicrinis sp. FJH54]|uniref:ferredoxin--NADP reductase n=1 Tax=Saccharicrinis sp. FJH54 TaxID=3344665 RepID=UPI0035D4BC16
MDLKKVKILEQIQLSQQAFLLKTERIFDFKPGQSVAVTVSDDIPPRLYSVCSGLNRNYIGILYKVVNNGTLTPRLSALKTNDILHMSEPLGSFVHGTESGFWIASGTGIAPFISMLESGITQPVKLLYGAGTGDETYFGSFLHDKLGNRFVPCITREEVSGSYQGRITQWLKEAQNLPMNIKYYLCGSPEMVVDVRDILIEKGVEFRNIASEIYF